MNAWVKVVTHPLGLAAFALFIGWRVFSAVAKRKQARELAWIAKGIFVMACIALLGGLVVAYGQAKRDGPSKPATVNQQQIDQINQQSSGNGAVNATGVQGSITTGNRATGDNSAKTKKKAAQ